MMYRIAVIESDEAICNMIKFNLGKREFRVTCLKTADEAKSNVFSESFDLFIIDTVFPGLNSFKLIHQIHKKYKRIPVLIIIEKCDISAKMTALKAGANEYLEKPFTLSELHARIRTLIHDDADQCNDSSQLWRINGYKVDFLNRLCDSNLGPIVLSERECDFLFFLIKKRGEILPRSEVLAELWETHEHANARTIDNFILKFRKMFETDLNDPRLFKTLRKTGYRLEPEKVVAITADPLI